MRPDGILDNQDISHQHSQIATLSLGSVVREYYTTIAGVTVSQEPDVDTKPRTDICHGWVAPKGLANVLG